MSQMAGAGRLTRLARRLRAWRFQVALLLATLAVGVLAFLVRTALYLPIDVELTRAIQAIRAPWLDPLLSAVTWAGMPPQVMAIVGAIVLGLFLVGLRVEALLTLLSALGGAGLWYAVAAMVERPRPSPELVQVARDLPYSSFPSGHVLNLTAILGFLLYLVYTHLDPGWTRRALMTLCVLPVLVIGFARIRDGAHWPSDVLGGYLLGCLLLTVTIALYHRAQQRWSAGQQATAAPPHPTELPDAEERYQRGRAALR
jgi:membrane-associated phospholipid phosphatase